MSTTPPSSLEQRAASTRARIAAQARFDAVGLLSHPEQLLVSVILPLLVLVGLTMVSVPDLGSSDRIDVVAPGVLALVIMSTAFTGQAITTAFDRRYGVLRLLGTTPLGPTGLIAARVVAVLAVVVVQLALMAVVAAILGWNPDLPGLAPGLVAVVVGVATFVSLALVLAGALRAEAVLALANLIWVLLLGLGGVVIPPDSMPGALAAIAAWTPSGALGEALRSSFLDGTWDGMALLILSAWCVVAAVAASRTFRWSD